MADSVYSPQDTIAAISTPPGEGGIAIVRVSGKETLKVAARIFSGRISPEEAESHTVHFGKIVDPTTQEEIDEVLLTVMRSPKTYTGEEVVEINCHGGFLVSQKVLEATLSAGARLAHPGEFTLRAFVNGRLDLSQAEAVAEVIRAKSDLALKVAQEQLAGGLSARIEAMRRELVDFMAELEAEIDFPEEESEKIEADECLAVIETIKQKIDDLLETYRQGEALRRGFSVVIAGRLPVRLVDSAGLRTSPGEIENLGILKTEEEIKKADLILLLFDASEEPNQEDEEAFRTISHYRFLPVINKIDIASEENIRTLEMRFGGQNGVRISALHGTHLNRLKEAIRKSATLSEAWHAQGLILINTRHREALWRARGGLFSAEKASNEGLSLEFIAAGLRSALNHLGEIVGETVDEEILNRIFEKFCIGK